jgi:ABC-type multidrug transport system fused ATPase/permease subunit
MLHEIRQRLAIVSPRLRLRWALLSPLSLISAAIESAAAGMVFLLVAVLQDPARLGTVPLANRLLAFVPESEPRQRVFFLCAAIGLFYGLRTAFNLSVGFARARLAGRTSAETSTTLFALYLWAPYEVHLRRRSSEAIANVQRGADALAGPVLSSLFGLVTECLVAAGIFAVLLVVAPMATLVAGGFLALLVALSLWSTRHAATWLGSRSYELDRDSIESVRRGLGGLAELRLLGRAGFFQRAFESLQEERGRLNAWQSVLKDAPRLVIETVFVVSMLIVVVLVLWSRGSGGAALPVLSLFAYAGFRVIPSANRIVLNYGVLRYGLAATRSLQRDVDSLRCVAANRAGDREAKALRLERAIEVENVSYTYPESDRPALSDVCLTIARGQAVGFVGPSGSGKSTLVGVMLGLLEPSRGRVLIDGVDIATNRRGWQRNLGYVPQAIFLVDDTLRRNIALGIAEQDIDPEKLAVAVRAACLDGLVAALPDGLETRIGEKGARLSGGERQRVVIARALYGGSEVVVFDEATSNLDMATENELTEELRRLRGDKTLLIVAHRLASVRRCDALVFLRDGRVEDTGTFDELLARSAAFRRLVQQKEPSGAEAIEVE